MFAPREPSRMVGVLASLMAILVLIVLSTLFLGGAKHHRNKAAFCNEHGQWVGMNGEISIPENSGGIAVTCDPPRKPQGP